MTVTVESMYGPLPEPHDERCEDCDRPAAYGVVLDDGRLAKYCGVHLVVRAGRAAGML